MVLTPTTSSGRAPHMCRGTEDERRWSCVAVGSRRSVQGDLSLGAQQTLGLSCCNLGATQLLPWTSAEDLLLCFWTTFAIKDQQLARTAVSKPIKERTYYIGCTRCVVPIGVHRLSMRSNIPMLAALTHQWHVMMHNLPSLTLDC